MSFNCFFGADLAASRIDAQPPIPPQTTLVVSQICIAARATYRGRVSVVVEGPKKTPITIATLHPDAGIFHVPVQLIFSASPKFTLVFNRKDVHDATKHRGAAANASTAELENGAQVHLTGYYEREADTEESVERDDNDDAVAGGEGDDDES